MRRRRRRRRQGARGGGRHEAPCLKYCLCQALYVFNLLSELILLSVCMPVILVQLRIKRPVYPLKSKRKLRLLSEVTGKTRRKIRSNFTALIIFVKV